MRWFFPLLLLFAVTAQAAGPGKAAIASAHSDDPSASAPMSMGAAVVGVQTPHDNEAQLADMFHTEDAACRCFSFCVFTC